MREPARYPGTMHGAVNRPAPSTPICPNCGRTMKLVRTVPRGGGLPDLLTFECRPCGVILTAAVEDASARPGSPRSNG